MSPSGLPCYAELLMQVTLQTDEDTLFKVNDHRLKIFLESKQLPKVVDEVDFHILP
jgi:hypothetical protein